MTQGEAAGAPLLLAIEQQLACGYGRGGKVSDGPYWAPADQRYVRSS